MNLRILHLSDLHFKAQNTRTNNNEVDAFNAAMVTGAMLTLIQEQILNEAPINIIIITGDIAFSGKTDSMRQPGLLLDFFIILFPVFTGKTNLPKISS